ncbi:MAG: SRPBCC domain-containing protein [Frankia sp.]
MNDPLRLSFDVACSVEHAFTVWTSGIGTWWPPDHTVTGHGDLVVVLQSGVGGRIYERTREGVEHDWGEVTVWEPPLRLVYLWHLRRDRVDATEVEVRFLAHGDTATRIHIEHRGWERLGTDGAQWRDRNRLGWQTLLPHFQTAITKVDWRTTEMWRQP